MGKRPVPSGNRKQRENRLARVVRFMRRWVVRAVALAFAVPFVLVPLYTVVPPVSTLMVWNIVRGNAVEREWVPLERIAPVLTASVLMSEDGHFCAHTGVDWEELSKVLESAGDSDRPRGASTIPMQTVKNVFLWQSRSVIRKALELPFAEFSDTIWGKRRMMEIYLNVVEWGPGIFGVEAAANHHFGTSAAGLNARQAALLAVTLPNPHLRNPARPSAGLNRLARTVERRARASGAYTDCLRGEGSL